MANIDRDALHQATFITYKEHVTKGRLVSAHVDEVYALVDKIIERYEDWKFQPPRPDDLRKRGAL